jgi:hypothetical protein
VGAVAELTSNVRGQVELLWQGKAMPASMKALGTEGHSMGDVTRAVVPEDRLDAAIDALRRERLRLISVTPLRTTLEQYFVEKLKSSEQTAGSTE